MINLNARTADAKGKGKGSKMIHTLDDAHRTVVFFRFKDYDPKTLITKNIYNPVTTLMPPARTHGDP
jgi:hypothetical protein